MNRLILLFALTALVATSAQAQPSPTTAQASLAGINQGISFTENRGQWPDDIRFRARVGGADLWVTDDGVVYDFHVEETDRPQGHHFHDFLSLRFSKLFVTEGDAVTSVPHQPADPEDRGMETTRRRGHVVAMRFQGAHARRVEGHGRKAGYHNYFLGNDPLHWASHVPVYDEVVLEDLYKGVNLRLYADGGLPRYDLVIAPGADLAQVRMRFDGADGVSLTAAGSLQIETSLGPVEQRGLVAYQSGSAGTRDAVASAFRMEADGTVGFAALEVDPSRMLVIDPLMWSTFLGGTATESALAVAVGSDGSTTVAGKTGSSDFPVTPGAYDTSLNDNGGAFKGDAFVSRLSVDGKSLLYSTYLGGTSGDDATAVAVAADGSATVVGYTLGGGFPTTPGAFDTTFNTGSFGDAYVARLSADGSTLVYSTFLGGTSAEHAYGVALGADASAIVTGITLSSNFPTTTGAFRTFSNGSYDAFVSQLSSDGSTLLYSTYLGGFAVDSGSGVALGPDGSVTVVGETASSNFPTTSLAYDTTYNGGSIQGDVFVTRLRLLPIADGGGLLSSTFLGGTDNEGFPAVAVGVDGSATVAGFTRGGGFPTTPGAYDTSFNNGNGINDVFVTRVSADGSTLLYSTFLGGTDYDTPHGIALGSDGSTTVTGNTKSTDFPTTPGAFDTTHNGGITVQDAFVSHLSPDGSALLYSTFLGGTGDDFGYGVALGFGNFATVAGYTYSSDFPVVSDSYDISFNGIYDAFVTRVDLGVSGSGCQLSFNKVAGERPGIVVYPGTTSLTLQVDLANTGPGSRSARINLTFTRIITGRIERRNDFDITVPETNSFRTGLLLQISPSAPGANYILTYDLVDSATGTLCDSRSVHFSIFPGDPPP